jgi:hypothetical protein
MQHVTGSSNVHLFKIDFRLQILSKFTINFDIGKLTSMFLHLNGKSTLRENVLLTRDCQEF